MGAINPSPSIRCEPVVHSLPDSATTGCAVFESYVLPAQIPVVFITASGARWSLTAPSLTLFTGSSPRGTADLRLGFITGDVSLDAGGVDAGWTQMSARSCAGQRQTEGRVLHCSQPGRAGSQSSLRARPGGSHNTQGRHQQSHVNIIIIKC